MKFRRCREHLSIILGALKEACRTKTNMATIWLDIANAYGYIPQKLLMHLRGPVFPLSG